MGARMISKPGEFQGDCRAAAEATATKTTLMTEPEGTPQTSSFGQAVSAGWHWFLPHFGRLWRESGHGRAGHTTWMNGWMGYVQPCFFYFAMLQRTRQYWMRDVRCRQSSIRGPEWPRVGKTMY